MPPTGVHLSPNARRPASPEDGIVTLEQVPPYMLIRRAAEVTGYSVRAIELKIAGGVWREGLEWVKAPDGHRMISTEGYRKWVEQGGRATPASRR